MIKLANKKLIGDCPTRWDSTYLMISRLLDVKNHLTAVLDELTWDSLTATQWKHLESIQQLLKPFAHHTNTTGAENSTTIAMVIPVLKELNLHLQDMSKMNGLGAVSRRMLTDLNRRFLFATDPDVYNFDAVYVASTLVNPGYQKILNDTQEKRSLYYN